jgi:peptidoglycan-associated lipoprotein
MLKRVLILVALTAFVVSCGSQKKKEDAQEKISGAETEMSFDPNGSDSGNIAGLSTIFFDFDSSRLTAEARDALAANVEWIKGRGNVNVQIEGHCDERGSIEYNLALGERRANAVKSYLVSLGVDANRLNVISYGKEKPLEMGDSEAAFSRNRRANFLPMPQ